MFVLENIAVEEQEVAGKRWNHDSLEAVNLMKVAYNSSIWVVCWYVLLLSPVERGRADIVMLVLSMPSSLSNAMPKV